MDCGGVKWGSIEQGQTKREALQMHLEFQADQFLPDRAGIDCWPSSAVQIVRRHDGVPLVVSDSYAPPLLRHCVSNARISLAPYLGPIS